MTKVGRCLLALTVGAGMIFASQSGYPFYQSSQQNRPLATFTNGIPVSLTSVAEGRPSGEQLLILQNAPRCPISSSPYPLNLMIRTGFNRPVLSLDQDLDLTAYEVLDEGERLKRVSGFSAQVRSANPMSVYIFMPAEETIFTSTDEQGRIRSFLIELDPVELKTPLPSGLRKSERPFFILNVRKVSVLQDP